MTKQATGEFDVQMRPGDAELDGAAARWEFEKSWTGGLAGTSRGVMLSAGDPAGGAAGYVALEAFAGSLDGLDGRFVLSQLGQVTAGQQTLLYDVVPGTGAGALAGLTGRLTLTIEDGAHTYALAYDLS